MNRLKTGHLVEAAFWLVLASFLFYYSFEFNKDIEIYKYGASSWPRAILLLIVVAALGQLLDQRKNGDMASSNTMAAAHDDSAQETTYGGLLWYAGTFFLLLLPFIYMVLPERIAAAMSIEQAEAGQIKIYCAVGLFVLYLLFGWRNHVGAIMTLPIFFAALMEDMGFYALAPVFIIGIMILMGERRVSRMALVMPFIYGLLLAFFVSLLYVGLPVGNVNPFYDFGNWVVTLLQ